MKRLKLAKAEISTILKIVGKPAKKRLLYLLSFQTFFAFLDLLGVGSAGLVGLLIVRGIESTKSETPLSKVTAILGIQSFSPQSQIAILGIFTSSVLILKTFSSLSITRSMYNFLSQECARLSGKLLKKIMSQNAAEEDKNLSQETLYVLNDGIQNLYLGVIASSLSLIADVLTLTLMLSSLLYLDIIIAMANLCLFILIAAILNKILNARAHKIGLEFSQLSIKTNQKISEILNSSREIKVRNRQQFYIKQIQGYKNQLSVLAGERNFQPYISKYVIEGASVLSILLVAGFEFGTKHAVQAAGLLLIFIAASSRMAPAFLRLQQSLLTIRSNQGSSQLTLNILKTLSDYDFLPESAEFINFQHPDFKPSLEIRNMNFKYPGINAFALQNINLSIPPGSSVAIVGPSGSGKSTLLDLILGIILPSHGEINISGTTPQLVAERWSGAMSYVPQSIFLISGTVRENVSLGYEIDLATDQLVERALAEANVLDEVQKMPNSLDSDVGENGCLISGGQRQRIGIARAFFTSPKLLVLDEATSALDAQSEEAILHALKSKEGKVTVISVAHRLSTVRNADIVVYLENGKVLHCGTFLEVRKFVSNFDKQSKLMGL